MIGACNNTDIMSRNKYQMTITPAIIIMMSARLFRYRYLNYSTRCLPSNQTISSILWHHLALSFVTPHDLHNKNNLQAGHCAPLTESTRPSFYYICGNTFIPLLMSDMKWFT